MEGISKSQIELSFDKHIVSRGVDYFKQRMVLDLQLIEGGGATASVKGAEGRVYQVVATRRGERIVTRCSCPYADQCKHGVAVAYAWLLALASADVVKEEKPNIGVEAALSSDLRYFLRSLEVAQEDPSYVYPNAPMMVTYVVSCRADRINGPRAIVTVLNLAPLKSGGMGAAKKFPYSSIVGKSFQKHVNAYDRELLIELQRSCSTVTYNQSEFVLEGRTGATLFKAVIASGRAVTAAVNGKLIVDAGPRKAVAEWNADSKGFQTLSLKVPPFGMILAIDPPYYLDHATGASGPVVSEIPLPLIRPMLQAPTIAPEYVEALNESLERLGVPDFARPKATLSVEELSPVPIPCLVVDIVMCKRGHYGTEGGVIPVPFARLSFDYAGRQVVPSSKREIRESKGGRALIIHRSPDAENSAERRLCKMGWTGAHGPFEVPTGRGTSMCLAPGYGEKDEPEPLARLRAFLEEGIPALEAEGWRIDVSEATGFVPFEEVEFEIGVEGDSGNDWFEFRLGIRVGDKTVDLRSILPQILGRDEDPPLPSWKRRATMFRNQTQYLKLDDGTLVAISRDRVVALLQPFRELFGPVKDWPESLRLARARMMDAEGVAEAAAREGATWLSSAELTDLRTRLREFDGLAPIAEPSSFQGTLRPYQREGLAWLQFLREYGFGGILADDMGLGKTVQVLAHICLEKDAGRLDGPVLVVAPTSTLPNWRREAEHFAPHLKVVTLQGAQRAGAYLELGTADIALTNFAILARDREQLLAQKFHLVVLDEAQNIKNWTTASAKVARELKTRYRLCLTGTPVENHLDELWSLFHFLMPGFLGTQVQFRKSYRTPIEQRGDGDALAGLLRHVRPFMLRRTKEVVLSELPPKTEIVEIVDLEGAQRDLYETVRVAMDKQVRDLLADQGLNKSRIHILDALLKLRQACCDPRLLKLPAAAGIQQSAKLDRLAEMVSVLIEDGRKILLFSQFTSMLDLIEERLKEMGIRWVRISGETVDRETPVRLFEAGVVPLFLISLKAGGTGLNLVAADTVIHYDPWWNPAVERQATDRAHRMGQTKSVMVYKLVASGTVEEKILDLQKRKAAVADAILSSSPEAASSLGQEDLVWLFDRG